MVNRRETANVNGKKTGRGPKAALRPDGRRMGRSLAVLGVALVAAIVALIALSPGRPPRTPEAPQATPPAAPVAATYVGRGECATCHVRRGEIADDAVRGRPRLDGYRPALLAEGLYFADGQIEDEVYEWGSFRQSRMYRAGVTCGDCHDPHSLKLRADGNALCAGCQEPAHFDTLEHHRHPAGSRGAQCVACHMPARTYMAVDEHRPADRDVLVALTTISRDAGDVTAARAYAAALVEAAPWDAGAARLRAELGS